MACFRNLIDSDGPNPDSVLTLVAMGILPSEAVDYKLDCVSTKTLEGQTDNEFETNFSNCVDPRSFIGRDKECSHQTFYKALEKAKDAEFLNKAVFDLFNQEVDLFNEEVDLEDSIDQCKMFLMKTWMNVATLSKLSAEDVDQLKNKLVYINKSEVCDRVIAAFSEVLTILKKYASPDMAHLQYCGVNYRTLIDIICQTPEPTGKADKVLYLRKRREIMELFTVFVGIDAVNETESNDVSFVKEIEAMSKEGQVTDIDTLHDCVMRFAESHGLEIKSDYVNGFVLRQMETYYVSCRFRATFEAEFSTRYSTRYLGPNYSAGKAMPGETTDETTGEKISTVKWIDTTPYVSDAPKDKNVD